MPKLQTIITLIVVFIALGCHSEKRKIQSSSPQIIEAIAIDSVTSDFPVGFSFITTTSHQFIAYYNKTRNLTVAWREITNDKWSYKVLPTRVGWDSHNRITMMLDRDSCLHVTGNMHNDSMTYFISQKPNDVVSLERQFPLVVPKDELSSTYPGFTKLADGQLVFSYRKGGSGNGITISNIYDEKSKSFSRLTDQPLFDGLKQMSAYASGPRMGPDGWFHVIWLWRNTPHCETNHHLSYARSKDLVHWETARGTAVELPITPEKHAVDVDPTGPGGGMINGAFRLFFDNDKKPLIAYMKYDEAGNNQLYLAKFQNEKWMIKPITNWNYRWAFEGSGSISFEIRVGNVTLQKDNAIISYSHKALGNGEVTVDLKTLSPIKEEKVEKRIKTSPYPKELLSLQSGMEGAQIHWERKNIPHNADEFYALRWETLGKRRFYEAPEEDVRPSALMLYRIHKGE